MSRDKKGQVIKILYIRNPLTNKVSRNSDNYNSRETTFHLTKSQIAKNKLKEC